MPAALNRIGPVQLSATLTTNLYDQSTRNSLLKDYLVELHATNSGAADATFSMWIGTTGTNAAGSLFRSKEKVALNKSFDWYGRIPIAYADFIVGGIDVAGSAISMILVTERWPA